MFSDVKASLMKNPSLVACAFASAFLVPCTSLAATSFEFSINLYDSNNLEYLHSVTNAVVYTEVAAGSSTYWKPSSVNTWGEVIYRFPIGFSVTDASVETEVAAFTTPYVNLDLGAEAYLDVSADGILWNTVLSSAPGSGGYAVGPGNVSSIVAGSDEIWVRARLWSTTNWPTDGSIFAQFMRTNPGTLSVANGGASTLRVVATGVPEPASAIIVACFVGYVAVRSRRRSHHLCR